MRNSKKIIATVVLVIGVLVSFKVYGSRPKTQAAGMDARVCRIRAEILGHVQGRFNSIGFGIRR